MRKKVFVLLFCFGLVSLSLVAQNELLNLEKYWYYRWRFQKSFVKIGDCDGCSIPCNERHHYSWDNSFSDNLKFGDGTISLGTYISVLATEYDLLSQNGQNTLQTRKELYYALLAFNRLDMKVEDCMNMSCISGQATLNGFFMRDDVPSDFLVQHPELMPANETSPLPVGHVATNYVPNAGNGSNCAEESHDQIINMLMGLKMVSKFVPSGVFYKGDADNMAPFVFQDGQTDILMEAKQITTRMVGWIKDHAWMIQRPCSGGLANGGYGGNVEIHWAWAFNEIAFDITNDSQFTNNNPAINYCSWMAAVDAAILAGGCNYFVSHGMTYQLIALGADVFPMTCGLPNILSNDRTILANQSSGGQAGKCVFEWMPLMHSIFDNYQLNGNLWPTVYEDYLNSAPCTGPYAFKQASAQHPVDTVVGQHYPYPSLNVAPYNWSSPSLLFGAEKRWTNDDIDPPAFEGEYNGLDYMFMYNLYRIRKRMNEEQGVDYRNLIDYMVTMDLPFSFPNNPILGNGSPAIGDDNFPADFFSFTTLKTNKKMESDANASFRAGSEVVFLPGLEIKAGAEMHAYIDGLSCDRNDNNYHMFESHTESVQENKVEPIVYPNPSTGIINVRCELAPFWVKVYNVLGELIYEQSVSETETQIDLSSMPKAIYMLDVKCNGTNFFKKISLQ